ncbi:MAG: hypothetical protein P9L94_07610 [Candidatus Hinthialibacter antarcticus]|nr:hypothetical protein [Candidatus Hinthialibacter antarcticus]
MNSRPPVIARITRREWLAGLSGLMASGLPQSFAASEFTCALYGFSSNKAPFASINHGDLASWLRDHGVNAVFVYSNEDEDVLKRLKSAGVALYQSMGVFVGKADYQQHPEWRPVVASGEAMKPDEWYYPLSPNHPALRKQRLERLKERLQNPYIDGVWLDFIRYPLRWENGAPRFEQACFSQMSLDAFQAFSGLRALGETTSEIAQWIINSHLDDWTAFKIESIRSWVEDAASLRDGLRPDARLGFFGVPWAPDEYDNALHRIVGQDYAALANHADIISPMIYHRMIGRPVERVRELTLALKQSTQKPVWPVLQTMNLPDELPKEEFLRSIDLAASASQQGLILFAANHIENEKRWSQLKASIKKYVHKARP